MLSDYYYLLSALSIIVLVLVIYFSNEEIIKVDKTGREYDASIFIITPLSVICLVLFAVLAYQCWNIEILYTDGTTLYTETISMGYFTVIWFLMFVITCALLGKAVFEFFINSFYDPKGKWQR